MKNFIATFAATLALSLTAQAGENWQLDGLEMPESALFDAQNNRLIISNIKGHPLKADANGYLSLVSLDGQVITEKWAEGMDAPKGMTLVGDTLLVGGINKLHIIDNTNGKLLKTIEVAGAKLLNDITSDGTTAYISDMVTHTIWRYQNGDLTKWLQTPALNHPNGLLLEKDRLIVGSWGPGMQADFSTKAPGDLLSINLKTKKIEVLSPALGNLDGVIHWQSGYAISDWISGDLYIVNAAGELMEKRHIAKGLADIGTTGKTIIAPIMMEGRLLSIH